MEICTNYITLTLLALAVFLCGLTVRLVLTEDGNDWLRTSGVRQNRRWTEEEKRLLRVGGLKNRRP